MKSYSRIKIHSKISSIGSIPLIYINSSRLLMQLDFIFNKINKMPLFHNLEEDQEILFEKTDDPNLLSVEPDDLNIESPMTSFNDSDNIINTKLFEGKYENLLNSFSNMLYEEINSVYLTYLKIEKMIFNKINSLLAVSDNFQYFNLLQVVTKLKEINELSLNLYIFSSYIEENMRILKKICYKIDFKISPYLEKGYLSYQILKNQFELPDTPISYMLKYKIIDESSFIIDFLRKELLNRANKCDKSNITKIEGDFSESLLSENDINLINTLEKSLTDERVAKRTKDKLINNINEYNNKINKNLQNIIHHSKIRLKYTNISIFIRCEYSGLFVQKDDDKIFINSLMDEENVIHYFLSKSVYNDYIGKKITKLTDKNHENIILILVKQFVYLMVFCFSLMYDDKEYSPLYIGMLFIGIFCSKIFCGILLKEGKNHFSIIILSQLFILIGTIIPTIYNHINKELKNIHIIVLLSRFLIGFGSTQSFNRNYIMTYVPRVLLKYYLKKYNSIKILSFIVGFFISLILILINENIHKTTINEKCDIVSFFIIFIIFIILLIKFYSPNNNDFSIVKDDNTTTVLFNDYISYGKKKNISLSDKKNVERLNNTLNKEAGNYIETNKIKNFIEKQTIKENRCCSSSYFSFISICLILISQYMNFIMVLLYIINTKFNQDIDFNPNIIICIVFLFSCIFYLTFHDFKKCCKCVKYISHHKRISLFLLQILQIIFYLLLNKEMNYVEIFLIINITINCFTIENKSLKLLSRLISKNFKLCGLNIYFYLDFFDNFSKFGCCLLFYKFKHKTKQDYFFLLFNNVIEDMLFKILISINILSLLIFILCIKNFKKSAFSRLITKKSNFEIGAD